jgi:hypothetical protein
MSLTPCSGTSEQAPDYRASFKTLLSTKLSDLVTGNLACEIKVDSIPKNLQMSQPELFDGLRRQIRECS